MTNSLFEGLELPILPRVDPLEKTPTPNINMDLKKVFQLQHDAAGRILHLISLQDGGFSDQGSARPLFQQIVDETGWRKVDVYGAFQYARAFGGVVLDTGNWTLDVVAVEDLEEHDHSIG